jgi:pimeloyl-ACP methyl ester carboxylesterase
MKIKNTSSFKDPVADTRWFLEWVHEVEQANQRNYEHIGIKTSIGHTQVWGLNTTKTNLETLVVFPGARTSVLFFDLDRNLNNLKDKFRIFLVETNGLPNNSDASTPDIKSDDFGHWANEVLDELKIKKAYVAGASFGGLICMKLAITNPEKIHACFLLNPGCIQMFSFSFKNLYYNLLPIISPNRKNVEAFLNKAIFCAPTHELSAQARNLLIDYEIFALTRFNDKTQKPYDMGNELRKVKVDTFLLLGDKDLLFPYQKSVSNAQERISSLKDVKVFPNVGHGIETYGPAMNYITEIIQKFSYSAV